MTFAALRSVFDAATPDVDRTAAKAYTTLPFKNASYGRLIAAHAFSPALIILTNKTTRFFDVPELRAENWSV